MIRRFDESWFSQTLQEDVTDVEWSDVSALGFVSGMKKVKLTLITGETRKLVLKLMLTDDIGFGDVDPAANLVDIQTVINLGCAREADFYNAIQKRLSKEKCDIIQAFLPKGAVGVESTL